MHPFVFLAVAVGGSGSNVVHPSSEHPSVQTQEIVVAVPVDISMNPDGGCPVCLQPLDDTPTEPAATDMESGLESVAAEPGTGGVGRDVTLPCGHHTSFHTVCLEEWSRHNNGNLDCPLCRTSQNPTITDSRGRLGVLPGLSAEDPALTEALQALQEALTLQEHSGTALQEALQETLQEALQEHSGTALQEALRNSLELSRERTGAHATNTSACARGRARACDLLGRLIFGSTDPPTSGTEYCADMVRHAVVVVAASSGFWGGPMILIFQDNICSYGSTNHCEGLVEGDSGGSFHKSGSGACHHCKVYFSIFGMALIVINIIVMTIAAGCCRV